MKTGKDLKMFVGNNLTFYGKKDYEKLLSYDFMPNWEKDGIDTYVIEFTFKIDDFDKSQKTNLENAILKDDFKLFEKTLLNGAKDWQQYSNWGCSFIAADDIRKICFPPYRNDERKELIEMSEVIDDWETLEAFDDQYDLLAIQGGFLENAATILFETMKEYFANVEQ